ncbi:Predicted PurR-regulated permease PerM [Pasteurella testudinis DSM 23072]|uniref:Predicted PurR-regulated permease PerM n=1 Tax=Pasteurella testudinis DSM 23072 TaxID=1122938 RepID=A0A1W1UPR1_9PAST|nr:AI-2E family transporter [Pasteurella testudinis]SMB83056.1 Predicted PurR-regulated permease PerM [Pasteurella testudinis DSM 23072]SUB51554.1 membrane protein [Pasteurella testudinis]
MKPQKTLPKATFKESILRDLVVISACLIIILAGVKAAGEILTPLLLALFIAIVCSPLVGKMMQYRIPQWLAITLLLCFIFTLFSVFATLVGASVSEFTASMPQYKVLLSEKVVWLTKLADQYNISLLLPQKKILESLDPNTLMNFMSNMLGQLSGMLSNIFILFLIVVFMLLEIPLAKKKLTYLVSEQPQGEQIQLKSEIYRVIDSVIRYLSIKTLVSIFTGASIYIVLKLLNIQYAVLWASVAFMLNYIPNIGSIIAAVPVVIQAFLLNGFAEGVGVIVAYFLVNTVFGNIVEPRVMGKHLGLSTLVVFISLIFWGWLLGTVGMFLSVPLTMATKIALEASPATERLAYLLGSAEK